MFQGIIKKKLRRLALVMVAACCSLAGGLAFASAPALAASEYKDECPTLKTAFCTESAGTETAGVAVDNSAAATKGDVYMSQFSVNKVTRYDSTGKELNQLAIPAGCTPIWLAVDSSSDASKGDVYVSCFGSGTVDRFLPTGALDKTFDKTGELAGFTNPSGIAVDPANGNLFVAERGAENLIREFESTGETEVEKFPGVSSPSALAVDAAGDVYGVVEEAEAKEFPAGKRAEPVTFDTIKPYSVAIDPSNEKIYVDENGGAEGSEIVIYKAEPAGPKLIPGSGFGGGIFGAKGSPGMGVSGETHTVYASDLSHGDGVIFTSEPAGPKQKLTVKVEGEGEVTGGGIACKTGDSGTCTSEEEEGATVKLTEKAAPGSTFTKWEGACSGAGACEVTMSAAMEVIAVFTANAKVALTITNAGTGSGEVKCEVNKGGSFGTCALEYSEGTELVLEGAPNGGSKFEGWSAGTNSAALCTTVANCAFTLAEASAVTATFNIVTTSPLTVFVTGEGKVNSAPPGITECTATGGTCTAPFEGKVTLTASAGAGYVFASWIGCKPTGPETCEVDVTEAADVVAVFIKNAEEVIITSFSGSGGTCTEGGLEIKLMPSEAKTYVCNGTKGTNGTNGTNGKEGPPGKNGTNGANGEKGANGANGAAGAQGPAGPAGATGPAGPAGKVKVTCKVKQQKKGKKVKVTCTVKVAKASAARVHWSLSRHGHSVAHGASSGRSVRLSASGLPAGRYTLTLISGSGKHESIRSESITLR